MTRILVSILLFAGLCAIPAAAQFSESFDSGTGTPPGWTLDAPTGTTPTGWSADALPATADLAPFCGFCVCGAVAGPTFLSAPNSLNFNNDVDVESGIGELAAGAAMSPVISLASVVGATLRFSCMEEDPSGYITLPLGECQHFVEIMDTTGTIVLLSIQLVIEYDSICGPPSVPPPQLDVPCSEWAVWHTHNVDLSGIGATDFRIRFRYNQAGEAFGGAGFEGWFIDDVSVICPDAIPPTVPTLLSPANASTVIVPPAVGLDWTDSTDTNSCGVAPIASYDVEVDVTNPPVAPFTFFTNVATSSASAGVLAPGTYFWRVRAIDLAGNTATSSVFSFIVETALPPLPPDTLFVNESFDTAQSGDGGFVAPVIDQDPVLSCIFRDANTIDFANVIEIQVSTDPLFVIFDWISGPIALAPFLAQDARCPDVQVGVSLQRNTVYYWRARFTDLSGLVGPFSAAQSFRIGDDFEFGVRHGSTHHGRRCWVATAAWGTADAAPISALQSWRSGTLEGSVAGRMASRAYHVYGAAVAPAFRESDSARFTTSIASQSLQLGLALLAAATLAILGFLRLSRPA